MERTISGERGAGSGEREDEVEFGTRIAVVVNGKTKHVRAGATLTELLHLLELDSRMIVVEHNREIVRRPALAETKLADGDNVELVHFVGGG